MPTENMQVNASNNDADENAGTMALVNYVRLYGADWLGGMRFVPSAQIPQGSTVVSATLSIKFTTTSYDTLYGDLYGEDGGNPGVFTTTASDLSNRTLTSASINVDTVDGGTDWITFDVSSIITELLASYNLDAIVLIIDCDSASSIARIVPYDSDTDNCPKLDIEYTTPSGSTAAVHMIDHRRRRV